jgi:cytoskeleton protein RodZ
VRESRVEFGKDLANLRTGKGVSLEDLASAIKVRQGLLKALEEGRFEALPPPIFVEGYLKAYAHHMGVEPATLLARYRGLTPLATPLPKAQAAAPVLEEEGQGSGWLKWILLVVVLAAAGYGAYYLSGRMKSGEPTEAPVQRAAHTSEVQEPTAPSSAQAQAQADAAPAPSGAAPQQVAPAGETAALQTAAGGETTPSLSAPSGASTEPPAAAPMPAEPLAQKPEPPPNTPAEGAQARASQPSPAGDLVLTAAGPCWCEVWADGRRVLYRMVTTGERLGFSGSAFKASVGNAGAVEMVYRGQRVPLPKEQGVVVKDLAIPAPPGGSAP